MERRWELVIIRTPASRYVAGRAGESSGARRPARRRILQLCPCPGTIWWRWPVDRRAVPSRHHGRVVPSPGGSRYRPRCPRVFYRGLEMPKPVHTQKTSQTLRLRFCNSARREGEMPVSIWAWQNREGLVGTDAVAAPKIIGIGAICPEPAYPPVPRPLPGLNAAISGKSRCPRRLEHPGASTRRRGKAPL